MSKIQNDFKNNTRLDASNQKNILMTIWQLFETEMLKHKYIHSILQQNKFNTINVKFKFNTVNVKFKFRILEAPLMNENMDTKI